MILIITVNYNNAQLTNETVKSIYKNLENESIVKVIIVDNNSDDSDKLIEQNNVRIIKLEKNIGYFPAINYAIKQIDVTAFDHVIICNNDLIFASNFFPLLTYKKYDEKVFAICPRILDLDNVDQNPMLDKRISRFKVFFYFLYYKNYFVVQILYILWRKIKKKNSKTDLFARHIFMGYGAIYILTKRFFENNSFLDSPPFLMFEETFLAYQIYKTGGIEFFDSSLVVNHKDHSTCSKLTKRRMYDISKESYRYFRKIIFKIPSLKN